MISTTADDATLETYVQNIVDVWNSATFEQLSHGRAWYPVAHNLAKVIGAGNARVGAGIIAALSPQRSWDENVKLAHDASDGNVHGHFGNALAKVRSILDGADPEIVLPMDAKTGHFFRNIADPTDPDPVTIDRWAYRVATKDFGEKHPGLGQKTRYATLALAYRLAARRLDEIPSVVQAVTWVVARES